MEENKMTEENIMDKTDNTEFTEENFEFEIDKNNNRENELLNQIQRLQAEFENYRKRVERDRQEFLNNANEDLVVKLLSVLDNFELAMQYNKDKGVNMIYSELYSILEKEGLSVIKCEGKFDPMFHEVLMQEEGECDGMILEELQKGYKLNDKIIRVSKVKISKVKEEVACDVSSDDINGGKNE